MSWDRIDVRRENKEEAEEMRVKARKTHGRKPTFDEIFERGLEELKRDMDLEKKRKNKNERDFMEIF